MGNQAPGRSPSRGRTQVRMFPSRDGTAEASKGQQPVSSLHPAMEKEGRPPWLWRGGGRGFILRPSSDSVSFKWLLFSSRFWAQVLDSRVLASWTCCAAPTGTYFGGFKPKNFVGCTGPAIRK